MTEVLFIKIINPPGRPWTPNSLDHRCAPPYKATEAYQTPPSTRMKSTGRCCSAVILCITTKVLSDLIYPQVSPEQARIQTTDPDSLKGLSILVFSELYLLCTSIFYYQRQAKHSQHQHCSTQPPCLFDSTWLLYVNHFFCCQRGPIDFSKPTICREPGIIFINYTYTSFQLSCTAPFSQSFSGPRASHLVLSPICYNLEAEETAIIKVYAEQTWQPELGSLVQIEKLDTRWTHL